ncbi:hypothetical protein J1N35_024703 [Gossypium stocksii]|uniref:Uncharacterized protein n=1 Tax=Gossypium stocksii TaxID=47602 RepID=A0A9D3ZVL2_9ROSI|nr:hypothetical protein J1N35_024703 [Gossypium stocksii]
MLKEIVDQVEPMETCGRAMKASRSRDMLSTLKNRVVNLEESKGYMRETLEEVEGRTDDLDSIKEQLRDFTLEPLDSNVEKMQGVLNSIVGKLMERGNSLRLW